MGIIIDYYGMRNTSAENDKCQRNCHRVTIVITIVINCVVLITMFIALARAYGLSNYTVSGCSTVSQIDDAVDTAKTNSPINIVITTVLTAYQVYKFRTVQAFNIDDIHKEHAAQLEEQAKSETEMPDASNLPDEANTDYTSAV